MSYHRTTAMTAASRRTKALQLGTALATTLFAGMVAAPAFGQELPVVTGGDLGDRKSVV